MFYHKLIRHTHHLEKATIQVNFFSDSKVLKSGIDILLLNAWASFLIRLHCNNR